MANQCAALLLVVCLIAATIVDAQESLTPCLDQCVSDYYGEHPSNFCTTLCNFGCTTSGLAKTSMIEAHGVMAEAPKSSWAEAPELSWAEAPQFSRKVQAQFEKDYKAEMQSFH